MIAMDPEPHGGSDTNLFQYFNDPRWMNFEGPVEESSNQMVTLPPVPGLAIQCTPATVLPKGFMNSSDFPPPRHLGNALPGHPHQPRGYRRGNTISSYHQPRPPRYLAYPAPIDHGGHPYATDRYGYRTNNPNSYWQNGPRQTGPPRNNTPRRDDDRRANVRYITTHQRDRLEQAKDQPGDNKKPEHDDPNKIDDGKEKAADNDELETIPLRLNTARRKTVTIPDIPGDNNNDGTATISPDRNKDINDNNNIANISTEVEHPKSPRAVLVQDPLAEDTIIDITGDTQELDMPFGPPDKVDLQQQKRKPIEIRLNVLISPPQTVNKDDTVAEELSFRPVSKPKKSQIESYRMDDDPLASAKIVLVKSTSLDALDEVAPQEFKELDIIDLTEDCVSNADIVIPNEELEASNKQLELENGQHIGHGESAPSYDSVESKLRQLSDLEVSTTNRVGKRRSSAALVDLEKSLELDLPQRMDETPLSVHSKDSLALRERNSFSTEEPKSNRHKSTNHADSTEEKLLTDELKESKQPAGTDKRRQSSVKVHRKRKQSSEPELCTNKKPPRRNNCNEKTLATCAPKTDTETKSSSCTDSTATLGLASTTTEPELRHTENILDTLRKNDSYLANRQMQCAIKDMTTVRCDDEVGALMCTTPVPAKIRGRRRDVHKRSKSVDHQSQVSETTLQIPARITNRRRTILDATDWNGTRRPRSRSRANSRNRDSYQNDPDFKVYCKRADTSVRMTRSKNREQILSRQSSTDALVPNGKSPDADHHFFQQSTPPATPRSPRQGDHTPENMRALQLQSAATSSGLDKEEVCQNINHVYAPALFNYYDFSALRQSDPRLNRKSATGLATTADEEEEEEEEETAAVVDEITLQNTLANKIAPAIEEETAPIVDPQSTNITRQLEDLRQRPKMQLVLHKLTAKEIKRHAGRRVHHGAPKRSRGEQPQKLAEVYQPAANKIPCSIAISAIGLPELKERAANSVVDEIMKQMDVSGPRAAKDLPKVRRSVDQLETNHVVVDNAITKPLSNKPVRHIAPVKKFDTFGTVSPERDRDHQPLKTKHHHHHHHESKEIKLKRLFEAEARQIYKIPRTEKKDGRLVSEKMQKGIKKDKEPAMHVRSHQLGTIEETPYPEEYATEMRAFMTGVEMMGGAATANHDEYLHESVCLPCAPSYTEVETLKPIPALLDASIEAVVDDNDVLGRLIINEEPAEVIPARDGVKPEAATKSYVTPTVIATIDLLAKSEDEVPSAVGAPPRPPSVQPESIVIIKCEEYVETVISAMGQYVQLEKNFPRIQHIVKSCTKDSRIATVDCDDLVEDFRRKYMQRLGSKIIKYTDSIEIQGFKLFELYNRLTTASLQFNGFKMKKLDVANAYTELYEAMGQKHERSQFCTNLYQLSVHLKELELAAEREKNGQQRNLSLNITPPIAPAERISPPSASLPTAITTSTNQTSGTVSSSTVAPSVVAQVQLSPTPLDTFVPLAQNTPESLTQQPTTQADVSPVNLSCRPNPQSTSDVTAAAAAAAAAAPFQLSTETTPSFTQHYKPVPPGQANNGSSWSGGGLTQLLQRGEPFNGAPRKQNHLTNVINSVAVVERPTQTTSSSSSGYGSSQLRAAVAPGRQQTFQADKRRIKHTPTLQQQRVRLTTLDFGKQILDSVMAYNQTVLNYYRMTGLAPPLASNVAAVPQSRPPLVTGPATDTLIALKNFRPAHSLKTMNNPPHPSHNSVVPPTMTNPRITVRSIEQLRRQQPDISGSTQTTVVAGAAAQADRDYSDQLIRGMIEDLEAGAIHQTHQQQQQQQQQQTTIVTTAANDGEDANTQTDPIIRNLSRDSGHGSGAAHGEESRETADFSCICGKTAEMICSCKLIVYCSAVCQANDWNRHGVDHVEA